MLIRPAAAGDDDAIWAIMEPILRAGETYTLPRDMEKKTALAYWRSAEHEVFVAEEKRRDCRLRTSCRRIRKAVERTSQIADT